VSDPERPLAAVDIDGVLADVRHRLRHLRQRPKDWDAFFAAAADDPLLDEGLAVAHRLAEDHELLYLSGRPERCRSDTQRWLAAHRLPAGDLLLRSDGDRRPARLVKVEALQRLAGKRAVSILVDDDPQVCEAAEAAGFPVLQADWMWAVASPADADALRAAQQRDGRS
jgi:uncharacterized HAD superfamily protein